MLQARDAARELEHQAKALAGEAVTEARSAQKARVTVRLWGRRGLAWPGAWERNRWAPPIHHQN